MLLHEMGYIHTSMPTFAICCASLILSQLVHKCELQWGIAIVCTNHHNAKLSTEIQLTNK